ncbi:hypothetical protein BH24CHL10_BH24CHL10_09060 [soil metagenome]
MGGAPGHATNPARERTALQACFGHDLGPGKAHLRQGKLLAGGGTHARDECSLNGGTGRLTPAHDSWTRRP